MDEEQRLAEELHRRQCNLNHTDACDWSYSGWDNPGHARQRRLKQARELLGKYTYDEIVGMLNKLDDLTRELVKF